MNIEQMLRDAIESKTARILKEEYGIEQKKYKLTEETMCFDGVTLHRIQALKDFGNVDAGELGGWVESEKNLSQSGDCWIAKEQKNEKVRNRIR